MEVLKQFIEIEIKAKEYGFYWADSDTIINQIQSEIAEIQELLQTQKYSPKDLQAEIGDLLHTTISLCIFHKFDLEETLSQSIEKFETRFKKVQKLATKDGLTDLKNTSGTQSLKYWNQAKLLNLE